MKQNHTKYVYFSIEGDWRTWNRKFRMSSNGQTWWGEIAWGETCIIQRQKMMMMTLDLISVKNEAC